MKLTELEPQFIKRIDDTHFRMVDTIDEADGIEFVCPKCLAAAGMDGEIMSAWCTYCEKPIKDGAPVAHGPDGDMHARCAKLSKAHGREVATVRCDNCGAQKPKGGTCFQCGTSERIG